MMFVHGVRHGLVSSGAVRGLLAGQSEKEMYEAGKRMGRTLKDSALVEHRLDVTRSENFETASKMLEDSGWGVFTMNGNRIVIIDSFLPPAVIHGYLEGALDLNLKRGETAEDIIVLDRMTVPNTPKST
jgi:predicted hydrocarbon binding protein